MTMSFRTRFTDAQFDAWLASGPTEDELRDAYLTLETARAQLWTPGHLESYRRDRFDVDERYVRRLVQLKWALATHWSESGQFARFAS